MPFFSVQYHPEASPGPHDSGYLFARFRRLVEDISAIRRRSAGPIIAAEERGTGLTMHSTDCQMPLRKDLKSVLLIGSGPIVIGQACEFDYSGTQALKALREEGLRLILVNSNPATIMTDPELADRTYIEPMTRGGRSTKIIERERPDALLPTVGGQTALNLAIELAETGVLDRLRRRADRREARGDQEGRGSRAVQECDDQNRARSAAIPAIARSHERGRARSATSSACR